MTKLPPSRALSACLCLPPAPPHATVLDSWFIISVIIFVLKETVSKSEKAVAGSSGMKRPVAIEANHTFVASAAAGPTAAAATAAAASAGTSKQHNYSAATAAAEAGSRPKAVLVPLCSNTQPHPSGGSTFSKLATGAETSKKVIAASATLAGGGGGQGVVTGAKTGGEGGVGDGTVNSYEMSDKEGDMSESESDEEQETDRKKVRVEVYSSSTGRGGSAWCGGMRCMFR